MPSRKRRTSGHTARNLGAGIAVVAIVAVALVLLVPHNPAPPISDTSTQEALQITPSNPVRGSQSAQVTIYEFGDFQCTYCDQWFKNTEPQILQNMVNSGQAKLVWKDFDYYGPDSTYASEAAYAAGEQGKFWQFYDLLYTDQGAPNSGWASQANLQKFAQQLGLNMTQFDQSFNSGKYNTLISANFNQGKQLGVRGTPTFIVVGPTGKSVTISGAQPYSVFQQAFSSVNT